MWPRPFTTPADVLEDVRERLRDILDEVLEADVIGRRWYECHLGNPLLPIYVLVDAPGNAIHVRTTGASRRSRIGWLTN